MTKKTVTATPVEREAGTSPTLPKSQAPVKTVPKPPKGADAELPVQKPGAGGAPVQTMSAPPVPPPEVTNDAPAQTPQTEQPAQTQQSDYTSLGEQIWGDGGTGMEGYLAQRELEKAYQSQTGSGSKPLTNEELLDLIYKNNFNIDPILFDSNSQMDGNHRPVQEWHSGADEQFLSDGSYDLIQHCKDMYAKATSDEDRAYWHEMAERIRARMGYSGGADGSLYYTLGNLGIGLDSQSGQAGTGGSASGMTSGGSAAGVPGLDHVQTDQLQALLEQWKAAAEQQANGQIDYATQQAITQLERALQDAQPQFKEQAESVSLDERQAMDNAALYAELRGDKGGIGQEQYSSIQNTAAQNRLAVQQAQTKLSTDTARQIEDLRAQGEFEKADKALEITQSYLAQLFSLEQWALEANLNVDQFNIQLQQWQQEYEMSMQQLLMQQDRWEQEFGFQKEQAAIGNQQWQQQFDFNQQQADIQNLLNQLMFDFEKEQAGISNQQWQQQFDAALDQWRQEFGLDQQQFQAALEQWEKEFSFQQEQAAKSGTRWTDPNTIYQALFNAGYTSKSDPTDIANYLTVHGVDTKLVDAYASQFISSGYSGANESNGWGKGVPEWENFFGVIRQYAMGGNTSAVDNMMTEYGGLMTAEQFNTLMNFFDSIGFDITNVK